MRLSFSVPIALVIAAALVGCSGDEKTAPEALATIELGDGSAAAEVTVEIADSTDERRRGLSGRSTLAPDQGMLFVNEQDVTVGYHMKDTLIPLSLAFIAADGSVVGLVDMEPCEADPCPVYEPPDAYRFGLEVNQGAFERWGIEPGDRLDLPVGG